MSDRHADRPSAAKPKSAPDQKSPLSRAERVGLHAIVFITGAAVMVIELLGTRIIAPFYGASLYVWSSLIAVTMIALAIGYFAGGQWADRGTGGRLSIIIALAAVAALAIPWLARPVLVASDALGLRLGAFVSALVLFSPSLMLLGMVGPGAVKLATQRLEGVGTSTGSIYAVSTIGSVVGTLLLGFTLFPLIGSREILVGLGVVLLALALTVALYERGLRQRRIVVSTAGLLIAAVAILGHVVSTRGAYASAGTFEVRSERESLYGWVRVIDQRSKNLRLLTSDASIIGATSIATGEGRLTYQDIVNLLPRLAPQMKRALVIGLGAGNMAKVLHDRYGLSTDTLEIDPAVADAATRWFGFKPTGEALVGDARYEIRRLQGPYDLIIHDCFTGGSEPAHLLTVEALSELRELLAQGGIVAVNFVAFSRGHDDTALASVARTMAEVFPHQATFISEPGSDFNDFIFMASAAPINLQSVALEGAQRDWLREHAFAIDARRGVVLTDNFNPLEHLQTRKAEHYRRVVADWLGVELLLR